MGVNPKVPQDKVVDALIQAEQWQLAEEYCISWDLQPSEYGITKVL